ncbi:hypothetical protein PoB_005456400 [Plakobranchus ocellatus]|uniref:Uncharacterized protein n=1 Tax=Plakobranchus ocellatus TaxID=259542 RepID=A0AAV4CAH9_9GAST|nr:hypothetical protein PoB_005456400 [Plakobranchus ocellatus]
MEPRRCEQGTVMSKINASTSSPNASTSSPNASTPRQTHPPPRQTHPPPRQTHPPPRQTKKCIGNHTQQQCCFILKQGKSILTLIFFKVRLLESHYVK